MAIVHEVLNKEMRLRELIQEFKSDFDKTGIRNGIILCENLGNHVRYTMYGKKAKIVRDFYDIDAETIKKFLVNLYNMDCVKENNCRIHYHIVKVVL